MSDVAPLTAQECEFAFDPARPLTLEQLRILCSQTGARVDDELWWEVLTQTGQLSETDHPLHAALLKRLAERLRDAGFSAAAERIDERVACARSETC